VSAHHSWTFAVVLVTLMTLAVSASAQVKIQPDFTFEKGKDSPGTVTFSHEKHHAKVDKCQACHVKIFKMKKGTTGPLTMEKMKAGEQCGACHNGRTTMGATVVFGVDDREKCETCHRK